MVTEKRAVPQKVPGQKRAVPQKVLGLELVKKVFWPLASRPLPFLFIDSVEEARKQLYKIAGMFAEHGVLFARPAPFRPRHGFVESREVVRAEEVVDLLLRVKQVDPLGGLILMPWVSARWNAVVTPHSVAIGPGNDGATAGRDAYALPAYSDFQYLLDGEILERWGVTYPYLEVVGDGRGSYVVQMRDGPPHSASQDYIPREMEVERVLRVTGDEDLLEWEAACASLRGAEGVVVWHPGGAIVSHYGVHAVLNGIPYVTSFEPKEGMRLSPTSGYKWTKRDLEELSRSFPLCPEIRFEEETAPAVPLAFAVVHSLGGFLGNKPNPAVFRLIGWAMAVLVKASALASVGELRYIPRDWRKEVPHEWRGFLWEDGGDDDEEEGELLPRVKTYSLIAEEDWSLDEAGRALAIALDLFKRAPWAPKYGGIAWARSTALALRLYNAIASFTERPTHAGLRRMGELANQLVHAVHNTGLYLDKMASRRLLDLASKAPGYVLGVRGETAEAIFEPLYPATKLPKFPIPRLQEEVCLRDPLSVRRALRRLRKDLRRGGVPSQEVRLYPGQITLDFNDKAHVQVHMPGVPGVNRSYGLASDLEPENPVALWLADYWHRCLSRGKAPLRSLNSSDPPPPDLRYYPIKVAVKGTRIVAIGIRGRWVRV